MNIVKHTHHFTSNEIGTIQKKLLKYYEDNKRNLPWRIKDEDPNQNAYKVWVSEIMLQQTQVVTVVEYFKRFMKQFPTIQSLAQSELEAVNEVWSGLGYYRRAAFLHNGAKYVCDQLDGVIPTTKKELEKLPGVGPYTAGAISSIAFEEESSIVDGNVIRVLSRMRSIGGNPSSSKNQALYWDLAGKLVKGCGDASSLNQSLMELGSEICQKKNPKCGSCPVSEHCSSFQDSTKKTTPPPAAVINSMVTKEEQEESSEDIPVNQVIAKRRKNKTTSAVVVDIEACDVCGDWKPEVAGVEGYPGKKPKTNKRKQLAFSCVLTVETGDGVEFVLVKRKEDGGLLSGLYEFPCVIFSDESHDLPAEDVRIEVMDRYLRDELGLADGDLEKKAPLIGNLKHTFSHINQLVYVEHRVLKKNKHEMPSNSKVKVVTGDQVKEKGVCKSTNKIHELFSKKKWEAEPEKKKQKSITNFFK